MALRDLACASLTRSSREGTPCDTTIDRIALRILLSAAVIAVLAGCNNDSAKRPVAGTASNPAAAPEVAEAPRQKPAPPAVKSKPKVAKVEKPHPGLDPGVNPLDVFAVVPGETKWQLASVNGKPSRITRSPAILPPKGVDSTRFQPLETDKPSAGPSKRQTSAAKRDRADHPASQIAREKKRQSTSRRSASRPSIRPAVANRPIADWPNEKRSEAEPAEPAASGDAKRLPPGFRALASAQQTTLGWPSRIRCEKDGAEMALVTGGAVVVGHDGGPAESKPQLTVVIDSFYMDVTEVTVGQFERYRKALKEEKGRNVVAEPANVSSPHQEPVLGVSLTQAQFYAKWAGQEIPTEAEWERAARGEGAFDHPWGNGRAIWKHPRTPDEIDPVKSFRTDLQSLWHLRPGRQRPRVVYRPLLADGLRRRAQIVERPVAKLERPADQPSGKCPRRQRQRPELGRLVPRRHERHARPSRRRLPLRAAFARKRELSDTLTSDFSGFSAA